MSQQKDKIITEIIASTIRLKSAFSKLGNNPIKSISLSHESFIYLENIFIDRKSFHIETNINEGTLRLCGIEIESE